MLGVQFFRKASYMYICMYIYIYIFMFRLSVLILKRIMLGVVSLAAWVL